MSCNNNIGRGEKINKKRGGQKTIRVCDKTNYTIENERDNFYTGKNQKQQS
jgi:hypothetical protein